MLRKRSLAMAVALALLPVTTHGVGLGQIRSSSALNQPFQGEIDLVSVGADEVHQVKVRLAPADAFEKAGVERVGALGKLEFKPYVRPNGQPAIRVSSQDPIREPFLNFLVELEWPQGKTVKEYTVLLDPPIFTQRRGAATRAAEVARGPAPAEPRRGAARPSPAAASGELYGPVRRGETLWSIADRTKPAGVNTRQALNVIFAANPQAFIRGDMNLLKAGAELRLPTPEEFGALDVQAARREYLEQAKERPAPAAETPSAVVSAGAQPPVAPSDQLRLMATPPESAAAAGPEGAGVLRRDLLLAQEKAESALQTAEQLQNRVGDLETQLRDMQRLLLLKDQQLADLQRQGEMAGVEEPAAAVPPAAPVAPAVSEPAVSESAAAVPTTPSAAPAPSPPAPPPTAEAKPVVPPEETAPAPEGRPVEPTVEDRPVTAVQEPAAAPPALPAAKPEPVAEEKPVTAVQEPAVAPPAPPAHPTAEPVKPEAPGGFAGLLKDPASLLGITVAAIGVLGALLLPIGRRRRKFEAEGVGPVFEAAAPPVAKPAVAKKAVEPAPAPIPPEVKKPAPAAAAVVSAAPTAAAVARPEAERVSTEDLAALDLSTSDLFGLKGETTEVDPTEEADVYIAYGRYEQAEQLLRLALEMEPGRLALKHKLLEVYFAARDASAYGAVFSELVAAGREAEDPAAWQRALRMGRQLDPANPAYAGAAVDDRDLEAALREAEEGLAADLESTGADLDTLKIDSHYSERAAEIDTGSVLNDLSLDLGTEDTTDKGSHPFKLDVSEELGQMTAASGMTTELDENDLSKAGALEGGISLGEFTAEQLEQEEYRAPDLSGIDLATESGMPEQDTTLMHADTTLELVDDVETKLDLARAYIELGDNEGARTMLEEVLQEGNDAQKANAKAMMNELA